MYAFINNVTAAKIKTGMYVTQYNEITTNDRIL